MLKKIAILGLCLAGIVRAEDPPKKPTQEEMMKCMEMMGTPNEHHAMLMKLEGTWDCKASFRMGEKEPWQSSMSTCTNKPLYDGKFLQQTYKGEMMGMPYDGIGLLGYDNASKKHTMLWADSMSTGAMMSSDGTCSADGKTITYHGKMTDPMTNKEMNWKFVMMLGDDPAKHVCEMSMPDMETGKEFVGLKLEMTKK